MHQRSRRATGTQEVPDQIQNLRVQDGRSLEVLSRSSRAGEHKYPRADDGANSKRSERPRAKRLLETMTGLVGLGDQFVDGLAAEELVFRCPGRWWLCQGVFVSSTCGRVEAGRSPP